MGGRVKSQFLTEDGRWVIYWKPLPDDPADADTESADYTGELILAMATLTEKQRFVIECYFGLRPDCVEFTVAEIACMMGISHQAVTRLMQRALGGLRRGLHNSTMDGKTPEIEKPA